METNRDDRINAAVQAAEDDQVIAAVQAARDAYAALHGHDVGAIFEDIRAAQEAADRAYVRYVEPLAEAIAPAVDPARCPLAGHPGPLRNGVKTHHKLPFPVRNRKS